MKLPGKKLLSVGVLATTLNACAQINDMPYPIQVEQGETSEVVNDLLSKTNIVIDGIPYTLEVYKTNIEYAINDENCSIDPVTSHQAEIPEGYDEDTVTACLYSDVT